MEKNKTILLVRTTLVLYKSVLVESWIAFIKNIRLLVAHVLMLLLSSIAIYVLFLLPLGILKGFLLALLLTYLVSVYFVTLSVAVSGEKITLREIPQRATEFFMPVLGVFFAFFILNIVSELGLAKEEHLWIVMSFNMLLAVLFNVVPEVLYVERYGSLDSFRHSFEFIRENFIEWFLPFSLFFLPGLYYDGDAFIRLFQFIFTTNPIKMLQGFILQLGQPGVLLNFGGMIFLFLIPMYFIFILRGVLYYKLSRSSRRKRIYQAQY